MIDDSLWELENPETEHPGIVLSHELDAYPIILAFCSTTDAGTESDQCMHLAPVPPFKPNTKIYWRKTKGFPSGLFSGKNPQVRHWGQLAAADLELLRKEYHRLHNLGLLIGRVRL